MGNYIHTSSHKEVLSQINEFRRNGDFCDVKVIVEGVEFPAHRIVLAGFSPYFKNLFCGNFADSKEESIKLETFELSLMESLLDYAYTGKIEISKNNIEALLHAANYLQNDELCRACRSYLEANLNKEDCVAIFNIAEVYAYQDLRIKARELILSNFSSVCAEVDFLELGPEHVIDLIKDDSLRVEKEEHVFDAVLQWFHYKQAEREQALSEVIRHVRLGSLDPYFLHTRLRMTDALRKSEALTKLLLDVFVYQLLPNRRSENQPSFSKQRATGPVPYVEFVIATARNKHSGTLDIVCLDGFGQFVGTFPDDVWEFDDDDDDVLASLATTSGNELYLVNDDRRIEVFDHKLNDWRTYQCRRDKLNVEPRVPDGKVVHNFDGRWYTSGPADSGGAAVIEYLDEEYYVDHEQWKTVPVMPVKVHNPGIVCVDGMIYVIGGKQMDQTPSMKLQRYDPFSKSWSIESYLTAPWKSLKACALNGNIYVFSDVRQDDLESENWKMNVYEVSSGQWKACPQLPGRFKYHTLMDAVASQGKIFVVVEKNDHSTVHVYAPDEDLWSTDVFKRKNRTLKIRSLKGVALLSPSILK